MARHDLLAEMFAEGIYFARPGCPWMRGTNENTNGSLRQYFPKATDLSLHSSEDLCKIEQRINTRPSQSPRMANRKRGVEAALAAGDPFTCCDDHSKPPSHLWYLGGSPAIIVWCHTGLIRVILPKDCSVLNYASGVSRRAFHYVGWHRWFW